MVIATIANRRSTVEDLSFGTAYAGLVLLAISMSLGPLNLLRSKPNPVHSAFRRDVGICAGLTGIIHTVIGSRVHMGGALSRYFIPDTPTTPSGLLFTATNYLGLVSASVLLMLVLISNSFAIKRLGLDSWKRLQRLAYVAAALVLIHGAAYQFLEKRPLPWVIAMLVLALGVAAVQLKGRSLKSALVTR